MRHYTSCGVQCGPNGTGVQGILVA
jgi:hypothetical protein